MDALDLVAKIKMDISEYEEGLDKAKSGAEKAGGGIGGALSKLASVGGKALVGLTKVTAAAVGAAAVGVGALVKSSVEAYSEYEQLVGGVQKLYGNMGLSLEDYAKSVGKSASEVEGEYQNLEKAQNLVLENAQNAYKTAGMSMNEYMDTATSFSASLINSLGGDTVKAAEQTDVAMRAISDNFNTFGGDIGMIQGAFQGFAKQNYTMLDNLKLGYGGTKEEMERLIEDANKYAESIGEASDLSIDSFSDVVTAIDLIQQKQQIAGTTAREASTTIQGSLGMLSAAWTNLVTGLGDKNADISQLIGNVVDSLVGYTDEAGKHVNGFLDNLLPVIENALSAIGTLVQELVPNALEIIPGLITDVLPKLSSAATELVQGMVSALSDNMDTISSVISQVVTSLVTLLPDIIALGGQIATTLGSAIIDNLDIILDAAGQILEMILTGMSENAGKLVDAAVQIIEMLAGFFTENIDLVVQSAILIVMGIAQGLMDNLDVLLTAAFDIIVALAEALISNIPLIIDQIPLLIDSLITSLVEFLPEMTEAWISLMDCLSEALPEIINSVLNALPKLMDTIVNYYAGPGLQQTLAAAIIMWNALLKALGMIVVQVVANVGMFVRNIGSQIAGEAGNILSSAKTMFMGLVNGAASIVSSLTAKVKSLLTTAGDTIKGGLSTFTSYGRDMIQNFINGIGEKIGALKSKVTDVASIIKSLLHFSEPDIGPLSDFHTYAPDMMKLFMQGIEDNQNALKQTVSNAFDFGDEMTPPSYKMASAEIMQTKTIDQPREFSNYDIQDAINNTPINLYITNEVDGKRLNENSYTYTVGRMKRETNAVRIAHGGA